MYFGQLFTSIPSICRSHWRTKVLRWFETIIAHLCAQLMSGSHEWRESGDFVPRPFRTHRGSVLMLSFGRPYLSRDARRLSALAAALTLLASFATVAHAGTLNTAVLDNGICGHTLHLGSDS